MLNIGDENFIRCVNCWMLHANNKSILDHWNNGACLFYCSVCGKSFHDNIKNLRTHFTNDHGIKFRVSIKPKATPKPKPEATPSEGPTNDFPCTRCKKSFKSKKALNCHTTVYHSKPDAAANLNKVNAKGKKRIDPMVTTPSQNQEQNAHPQPQPPVIRQFKDVQVTLKKVSQTPAKPAAIDSTSYSVRKKSLDDIQVKKPDTIPTLIIRRTTRKNRTSDITVPERLDEQNNELSITKSQQPMLPPLHQPPRNVLNVARPAPQNVFTTIRPSSQTHFMSTSKQPPSSIRSTQFSANRIQPPMPTLTPFTEYIKSEPVEDISTTYDGYTYDYANGTQQSGPVPLQPVEWISTDLNQYQDGGPRLKVKNLTELQDPTQRQHPPVAPHNIGYNSTYNTPTYNNQYAPNKDYGLQIQNVQSYQAPVEPVYNQHDYAATYSGPNYVYSDGHASNMPYDVHNMQPQNPPPPPPPLLQQQQPHQQFQPHQQVAMNPPLIQEAPEYILSNAPQHGLQDYGY